MPLVLTLSTIMQVFGQKSVFSLLCNIFHCSYWTSTHMITFQLLSWRHSCHLLFLYTRRRPSCILLHRLVALGHLYSPNLIGLRPLDLPRLRHFDPHLGRQRCDRSRLPSQRQDRPGRRGTCSSRWLVCINPNATPVLKCFQLLWSLLSCIE